MPVTTETGPLSQSGSLPVLMKCVSFMKVISVTYKFSGLCKCQPYTCTSLRVSTALKLAPQAPCLLTLIQVPNFLAPVQALYHERERKFLGRQWLASENATEASMSVVIHFSQLQGKRNQHMKMHTGRQCCCPSI